MAETHSAQDNMQESEKAIPQEKQPMKVKTIRAAFQSRHKCDRIAALKGCMGRDDIPINLLESGLHDPDEDIRRTSQKVCETIIITPGKVWRGIYNSCPEIVLATVRSMRKEKAITFKHVEILFSNPDNRVKQAAAEACADIAIPADQVFKWLNSHEYYQQLAAAYACAHDHEISSKYLGILLDIFNNDVHKVALDIKATIPSPPCASIIAPPSTVYKKCLGGVIIEAHIPEDAIVYGDIEGPCRANKAIITGIQGDYFGEKVGISIYDLTTTYRIGDIVEFDIEIFSRSKKPYGAPGFYFFCEEAAAKLYNL